MNPEYIAAGFVHTIPDKLSDYFLEPISNFGVILTLIVMITNTYMLRKLRRIKARDYITLTNVITLGIYSTVAIISSVLVSRLGPHGNIKVDDCDFMYMLIPRALFLMVAIVNVICFVINIFIKLKQNMEYKETLERGYYAEKITNKYDDEESFKAKTEKQTSFIDNVSSFTESVKEKVDLDGIKDKVSRIAEDVKDLINNRNNK